MFLFLDMEWHNQDNDNMEVDIGYVPKMEILSSMPSTKSYIVDQEGIKRSAHTQFIKPLFEHSYNVLVNRIKWDEEIDLKEAHSRLEKSFYPFKQVIT